MQRHRVPLPTPAEPTPPPSPPLQPIGRTADKKLMQFLEAVETFDERLALYFSGQMCKIEIDLGTRPSRDECGTPRSAVKSSWYRVAPTSRSASASQECVFTRPMPESALSSSLALARAHLLTHRNSYKQSNRLERNRSLINVLSLENSAHRLHRSCSLQLSQYT